MKNPAGLAGGDFPKTAGDSRCGLAYCPGTGKLARPYAVFQEL